MESLVPPPPGSGKTLMDRVEDSLLPLINLVFLLLMFFIVAGQLSDTPLPELPGVADDAKDQKPAADLVLNPDGRWQVGGKDVSEETLVSQLPKPDETTPLKIAAANELVMADLESVLRRLEEAGYKDVVLLTEPAS